MRYEFDLSSWELLGFGKKVKLYTLMSRDTYVKAYVPTH